MIQMEQSQTVCECGRDHRGPNALGCPVFNIFVEVSEDIRDFLAAQDFVQFGKDGPMAHCLRSGLIFCYDILMETLQRYEAASHEHPEWNLAEQLSRLRRYAEQVTVGCAEEKEILGPDPPHSVVEPIVGDEERTLRNAKFQIRRFYDTCRDVISGFMFTDMDSIRCKSDKEKVLKQIDTNFTDAIDHIMAIPKTQNAAFRDLTQRLYDIRKETLRLLCDFEHPLRHIDPYEDGF